MARTSEHVERHCPYCRALLDVARFDVLAELDACPGRTRRCHFCEGYVEPIAPGGPLAPASAGR